MQRKHAYKLLVYPRAVPITMFQLYLGVCRRGVMRVKLPPTKEKRWCSIRLNRHAQHWSNEFFIAEHSEMIKIFQFQKNHKEIQ